MINVCCLRRACCTVRRVENLETFVDKAGLVLAPRPGTVSGWEGLRAVSQIRWIADRCIADFFIGAHAAVNDLPLRTRDAGRYRTYYPSLKLITPDA